MIDEFTLRIASQIVVGIGFIGAGLIFLQGDKVQGLTTAAAMWVTAAIGMAVGLQLYTAAVIASIFTLIVILVFRSVEAVIPRVGSKEDR